MPKFQLKLKIQIRPKIQLWFGAYMGLDTAVGLTGSGNNDFVNFAILF